MIGTKIPASKRLINNPLYPPINPLDMSEANANNLMYLVDLLGSGDFLQDTAVLIKHLAMLRCREQATPNLTVQIQTGIGWFGLNTYINYAGGNSPVIAAPAANPRRDIITLRNDGVIYLIIGAEAAIPLLPTIPSTDIPLCQIYSVVGQVRIRDYDTQEVGQGYIEVDLRPFAQISLGGSAMPKLGLVARVQDTINQVGAGDTGWTDVVNFAGAGRLNSVHVYGHESTGGVLTGGSCNLRITVDGTVLATLAESCASGLTINFDLLKAQTDITDVLALVSQTAIPANDNPKGADLFLFKDSLRIEHKIIIPTGGNVTMKTTVDWEHE